MRADSNKESDVSSSGLQENEGVCRIEECRSIDGLNLPLRKLRHYSPRLGFGCDPIGGRLWFIIF